MFSSIVVGTNGTTTSRTAVATAAGLAKAHGAHLHLVWAYRPALQLAGAVPMVDTMAVGAGPTDAELHDQIAGELKRLIDELAHDGVDATAYPCAQAAAAAILDVAAHQAADLVVVGSKGMHGARRVLGSVPNTVAHQATCAVLIVPTDQ
jgi:nucleotide-binding universal stress UspA family protein